MLSLIVIISCIRDDIFLISQIILMSHDFLATIFIIGKDNL